MADIDEIIGDEHRRGVWSRRTLHDYAQRLRAFIAFAEKRKWCCHGLAKGVVAPGYRADEVLPKGIERNDVERLLSSVRGGRMIDLRDRAILMLFTSYGLRVAEVAGLRLDDFDWSAEMLRVRCPKPGRTRLWPLSQEVGQAILDYLQRGRPTGYGRAIFFTSRAPIRPLDRKALGKIVRDRLAGIGVVSGRRGPHALRHAAAQHLLNRGMSMKVIGDFLGHRDPSSTAIYAKVDLAALREVAAFDLEALL
ncbi:tyrosine-type recombinase/integrase [Marinovum sp. B10]